jgi:hypothetical protein
MGDGLEDVHLGLQKGELPLVKDEEHINPCEDKGKEYRDFGDYDNIPDAYRANADVAIMNKPDYPYDQNNKPGDLHDDEDEYGWPPFGLFHDGTFIPLEAYVIQVELIFKLKTLSTKV